MIKNSNRITALIEKGFLPFILALINMRRTKYQQRRLYIC
ncbi:hypothetical protein pb186bvf_020838 [Paramecium bursaria]